VNASLDEQMCQPCDAGSYALSFLQGCGGGVCALRSCSKCPVGVDCQRGTERPWLHFIPKAIKIGTRGIAWATIKGINSDHHVNKAKSFEIQFNIITGAAQLGETQEDDDSDNPHDYVWEYVEECTVETEPCEPIQVPVFYLRKCPGGTQLANSTIGSYAFDVVAQQCMACGPLNYIIDPNSGGECQECPKVCASNV
jgi:hypothetical protein